MNLKQTLFSGRSPRRLTAMLAFVIALLTPLVIARDMLAVDLQPAIIITWVVCLTLLVLSDMLAGPVEQGLWAGYLYVALAVAWLLMGPGLALLLIVAGAALTVLLRRSPAALRLIDAPTVADPIWQAQARISILGLTLLLMSVIQTLLAGYHPYALAEFTTVNGLTSVVPALVAGLALTQVLGMALSGPEAVRRTLWQPSERRRIAGEVLLLLVIVPLAVIHQRAGWIVFAVLMGLVASQAVRYRKIARTQDELLDRVQELSMLNKVGQNISANLMLEDVLLSIYDWVSQLTDVPGFYIALYDETRDIVEFPLVIQDGQRYHWPVVPLKSDPLLATVLRKRTLFRVDRMRIDEARRVSHDLPFEEPYRYYLGIPLAAGNKILGMMAIINDDARPIKARPEIPALEAVANQASLALRNATLYHRSVSLAENLALINQSVQEIMFNLSQSDALRVACDTAMQISGAQRAAIFMADEDDPAQAHLVQSVGLNAAHRERYQGPIHRPTLHSNRTYVVPDVDLLDERDALRELAAAGEFRGLAEIPLRSGSTVIGLLAVFYDEAHYLFRTELELLETLANQISAALDNAEMLNALEMYATEQAQLSHLSRITTASLEIDVMIDNITSVLAQIHPVGQVSVGLLTDDDWLEVYGRRDASVLGIAVNGIPELAVMCRDVPPVLRVFYHGGQNAQLSPQLSDLMQTHGLRTLALLPLVADGRLRGFILLGDEDERVFSDREWRLVELASNQVAMQVHNALLHRDTEEALNRRLQQLSVIENIAQQISNSLNLDRLMHNVLQAVIRITQASETQMALVTSSGAVRVIRQTYHDGEWHQSDEVQANDDGLVGQVLSEGRVLRLTEGAPLIPTEIVSGGDTSYTLLAVPLKLGRRVVGALMAQSQTPGAFNGEQVEFINNLAGHAVISIQNAWMLQERQDQIETLNQLRDLSLWLSIDSDRDSVVDGVLQTALSIQQGKVAGWYEYNDDTDRLELRTCIRRDGDDYPGAALVVPDAILETVRLGQSVAIADVRRDRAYAGVHGVRYVGLLAVPIKRHAEVREAIVVTLARYENGLQAGRNALELLAIQAAGHLDNAMLYNQISVNNNRMRAILDATRDGIILLDYNGRMVEANVSAEQLLGLQIETYMDEHFAERLMADVEVHARSVPQPNADSLMDMARILRLDPERTLNRRRPIVLGREGNLRYIEWAGSLVPDGRSGTMGRLLTFRDVTEQHLLEMYRDEVFDMVVHDLRSPLALMISTLQLISDELPLDSDDPLKDAMAQAMENVRRLLGLVESLLEIAKLQQRHIPMKWSVTRIEPIIEATAMEIAIVIGDAEIALNLDFAPDLPPVRIDEGQIRRVLLNLLDNALRYTPSGGKILVSAQRQDSRRIVIRVADSGPGIPPAEVDRVFEKFHQAKGNRPQRGGKGTGLGLTFCWLSLQAHGERIWVEPKGPLPGACFAFTLPVAPQ